MLIDRREKYMASRIMHLAIADGIAKETDIKDINRFKLGTILPDAYSSKVSTAISHLKTTILNGTKRTYKLAYFRETYAYEIINDSLYLGYYMHLIQDILYRQFVYSEHKWDPMPEGNVDRLHNDYRLLNTYVIEKYNILNELYIPNEIENERLFDIYPFDLEQLESDLHKDFIPYYEGNSFFFTKIMADEYITRTIARCVKEMDSLRKGNFVIDENIYAWNAYH